MIASFRTEAVCVNDRINCGATAKKGQKRLLVCGSHRSGTTWLGNVLAANPTAEQIYEPFSPGDGLCGISHPYIMPVRGGQQNQQIVDTLLATDKVRYKTGFDHRAPIASVKRLFVGTTKQRVHAQLCAKPPSKLLVKDPFASFLAEYFITQHNFKVVATVKHPAAFFLSLRRMGWERDLSADRLPGISPALDQLALEGMWRDEPAAQVGAFWGFFYRWLTSIRDRNPEQMRILRHEDVCSFPAEAVAQITQWSGWEFTPEMRAYVAETSTGQVSIPNSRELHVLRRNSASLPSLWRKYVSKREQDLLRKYAGAIITDLYPD